MQLLRKWINRHLLNTFVIVLLCQGPGEGSRTLRDSSRAADFPGAAVLPALRVEAPPSRRRWTASTSVTPPKSFRDWSPTAFACMTSAHARCAGAQARALAPGVGRKSGIGAILATLTAIPIPGAAAPLLRAWPIDGPQVMIVSNFSGVVLLRPSASEKLPTLGQQQRRRRLRQRRRQLVLGT